MIKEHFKESVYAVAVRSISEEKKGFEVVSKKKKYYIIKTPWRYWYADPIVFRNNNEDWLFVEKMDRLSRKGCIAAAKINDCNLLDFRDVLVEGHHLSYPMVFEKNGDIYMIPESTSNKTVTLYKCIEFPNKWQQVRALFTNVLYADTNVFFQDDHWYLITGEMDAKIGARTKTLIYNADRIEDGILVPLECNDCADYSYSERGGADLSLCR